MELIKDSKTLGALIGSIAKRGVKLDEDIHLAACSALYHAEQHGDTTLATKLIESMPKSGRAKALVHWFVTFGMLAWKKDNAFGLDKGKSKVWDVESAIAKPFWELLPEPEVKELTIEALVKMVKGRIERAIENDKVGEGFSVKGFEAALAGELASLEA